MLRRLNEDEQQAVLDTMGHLDLAWQTLKQIDLRLHAGDPELQEKIREARNDMKVCRKRLREARALRWTV